MRVPAYTINPTRFLEYGVYVLALVLIYTVGGLAAILATRKVHAIRHSVVSTDRDLIQNSE